MVKTKAKYFINHYIISIHQEIMQKMGNVSSELKLYLLSLSYTPLETAPKILLLF